MKDWIQKTREIAGLSDFHKPGRRTGCLIIKKGKVLSEGFNKIKNRFSVRNRWGNSSIHAEIDALNKINGLSLRGCVVYVLRQRGGISKPCLPCQRSLLAHHPDSIIYEDAHGVLRAL